MNSRLYVGSVVHTRAAPAEHHFRYPYYVYALDLDELPALDRAVAGFGYNRFALASIRDRDYLRGAGSIRERLQRFLEAGGCADGIARIELVTMARCLGLGFNPVNFYYCLRADGSLRCAVAEVNNTFGERHLYRLTPPTGDGMGYPAVFRQEKQFHVSPFNNRKGFYELRFGEPGEELQIGVTLVRDDVRILSAQLQGRRVPLSSGTLRQTLLRYPFTAALTVPRIMRQAATLYFGRKLGVHHKPPPTHPMTIRVAPPSRLQALCMRAALALLGRIRNGTLQLRLPDGTVREFGAAGSGPRCALTVHDYAFFTRVALGRDIGFGESYTAGEWDSDDLAALLSMLIANMEHLGGGKPAPGRLAGAIERARHALRRNSRRGSRRNIRDHYDLGNDFYRLFLDPETLLYSCALFERPDQSLADAQKAKIGAIIQRAGLTAGDHVLEIGCGWGGFAIEAVRRTGCRVTGITISTEQFKLARERVAAAGLSDQIEIVMSDYRDIRGAYDKIVSIEMLEAVGHAYFGAYFEACDRLLRPGGRIVLQVIAIPDERYERYRRTPDWIQKHIFPGGLLPSLPVLQRAMEAHSRLRAEAVEDIGPHYVATLRHWRERFLAQTQKLEELGFDRAFQRKWVYYLSYSEAGFGARYIQDLQIVLGRGD